jgi:hypothetical protein
VFEWHKILKERQQSLEDDERKGRPSTSRTEEWTEVIQKCLAEDRTLSVLMLEEMTGINKGIVRKILVEDFKSKKCRLFYVLICQLRIENIKVLYRLLNLLKLLMTIEMF